MKDEELDAIMAKIPEQSQPSGPCVDDRLLIAYRDRSLSEEQVESIDAHLASCADCRSLLRELEIPMPSALEDWARGTLKRRGPRRWMVVSAALAAGVLLAVMIIPRGDDALPEYRLKGPLGGVARVRGAAGESNVFLPASRFEIAVRPDVSIEGATLAVLVKRADGSLVEAPQDGLTRGEGGTFRYEIEAERLFGTEYGTRTVIAVIARGRAERRLEIQVEYREE